MKSITNKSILLILFGCSLILSSCGYLIKNNDAMTEETLTARPNYGNVMNFSLAYCAGEKNYYVNEMKHPDTGIVKKYIVVDDNNGKQVDILDVNALSFVIYENLIYFMNEDDNRSIYKMNIDGSDLKKVTEYFGDNMNYSEGWIYYIVFDTDIKMFKVSIENGEKIELSKGPCLELNVKDDWIYYIKDSGGYDLYRMKLDGTEDQLLLDRSKVGGNIYDLASRDQYLFFTTKLGLWRMDLDSSELKLLYSEKIQTYNFYMDKILFIDRNSKMLKVSSMDGSGVKDIQKLDAEYLNIAGDYIYYMMKVPGQWAQDKLNISEIIDGKK